MPRIVIETPSLLMRAAEKFAEKDGVSLNQLIVLALAEKVATDGAAEFFAESGKNGDVD